MAPGCGSGVALSGHFANGRSPDGVAGADQVVDVPHVLLRKREVVVKECDVQLGEETCVQVANIVFLGTSLTTIERNPLAAVRPQYWIYL